MVCLYCGSETAVTNSRASAHGHSVWRRRRCKACSAIFTTNEYIQLDSALRVAKNSSLAPFASEKLYMSIYTALGPSEQSLEHARALMYTITAKLLKKRGGPTIKAETIAEITARTLKRFNKLAYIKYVANHPSLHNQLRFK